MLRNDESHRRHMHRANNNNNNNNTDNVYFLHPTCVSAEISPK